MELSPQRREPLLLPAIASGMPQLDTVYCCDALAFLRAIPDKSVDLIATDPPYNGVKDEAWDNQWKSDQDYLSWIDTLCIQWRRILKSNGSLYVFASPRLAAKVEIKIGEHFNVLNHIVWRKEQARHKGSDIDALRGYFPQTERIIFADQIGSDEFASGESGYVDAEQSLKRQIWGDEIARAMKETATSAHELTGAIGAFRAVNHGGAASNWVQGFNIPTREQYHAIRDYFKTKGGNYLCSNYDELRQQYDELRRPFAVHPNTPYTDVWDFNTVSPYPGKHPCEKPLAMMQHIVNASSRPGAVVLDCFGGSGTTFDAARREGRRYIGCDADPHWVKYAQRRLSHPFTLPMFDLLENVG